MAALVLFLGGLCWVLSLWFPAFYTESETVMGYWVLISGWLAIVQFQFAWVANPLALAGVLGMYRSPIRATLFSALAILFATQTFWFALMPGKETNIYVTDLGIGFWLWYVSLVLLCIGVIWGSDEPVKQSDEQASYYMAPPEEPLTLSSPVSMEKLRHVAETTRTDAHHAEGLNSPWAEDGELPKPEIELIVHRNHMDQNEPVKADEAISLIDLVSKSQVLEAKPEAQDADDKNEFRAVKDQRITLSEVKAEVNRKENYNN